MVFNLWSYKIKLGTRPRKKGNLYSTTEISAYTQINKLLRLIRKTWCKYFRSLWRADDGDNNSWYDKIWDRLGPVSHTRAAADIVISKASECKQTSAVDKWSLCQSKWR